MTINREGFMKVLAVLRLEWASKETIINAGKKVGISNGGYSYVEWMQGDKFSRAKLCIYESTKEQSSPTAVTISSPEHVRYGSATYWKLKYESAMKVYQRILERSISLEEIPNLLSVTKVTLKVNKENVWVTQVHSSMEGKKILEKVSAIKEDRPKKEQAKKERKYKQHQQIESFFKCKEECTCGKNAFVATKASRMPVLP